MARPNNGLTARTTVIRVDKALLPRIRNLKMEMELRRDRKKYLSSYAKDWKIMKVYSPDNK